MRDVPVRNTRRQADAAAAASLHRDAAHAHAAKRRTARKSLRSFAYLLLCDAGTAHAAKSFFQLADRRACARLDAASAARGGTRNCRLRWPVAKKHGNYRCFCLRGRLAAGFAAAAVAVRALPIAAIGAVATRGA
ncbi:hypothetical protein ACFOPN_07540 [Xanthomonas hyacinthi]|uniref:hypothetical protein n=1 Tax=Xanthomonas hyacinthi TaxID=56455 RepID=UPI0011B09F16|nr:hypothetical protein [Xanthomonas hyacinthi]